MTLREIIYDINEKLNAYSDDHKISEEHIAFMVNNKRNLLLKQFMSNLKKEVPKEALQKICISLETETDCYDDSMTVLKSTIKIPPTLENSGRSNIANIYNITSKFIKNLNIIPYERFPFLYAEKYIQNQIFVSMDPNSYLVIYSPNKENILFLESLGTEGVFENPEEAYNLRCDKNSTDECDFYDAQYPIESSMIDIISNQIVQELLLKYQIPTDDINNGEELKIENAKIRKR